MRPIQYIAIFGATGMLGIPVAKALANNGFKITAFVWNKEKARKILSPGTRLFEGDLQDKAAIKSVLYYTDAIYINLSVEPDSRESDFQPEREGLAAILAVARHFPIRHIAYISSIIQGYNGFVWWAFDLKRVAVEAIKSSGIPYTIFYPSNFMETIPGRLAQGNMIALAGKPLYPNYWIVGDDYAKQVAASFKMANQTNKEYIVQGTEALTINEACKQFVKYHPHRKYRLIQMPLILLKGMSLFTAKFSYGAHILEAILRYDEKFQAQNTWQDLGKPTITLKEFVENIGKR